MAGFAITFTRTAGEIEHFGCNDSGDDGTMAATDPALEFPSGTYMLATDGNTLTIAFDGTAEVVELERQPNP